MKSNIPNIILKVAVFSAAPATIMYGLMYVFWVTIYITAPIFDPYVPYSTNKGDWSDTTLSHEEWGYEIFAIHSLIIGCISAYISRSKSWAMSILVFCLVVVISSVAVHAMLNLLGYEFYMETP